METIKCPKCRSDNADTATFCADCGTRLALGDDISISVTKTIISPVIKGSTIAGKYRIIEKLGEGGMGVVYKAEDIRLDRMVALKFLPPELMKDPDAKQRFIREAKAAAALSHPNICTIHEIDEEEGKSFIAMEYIEGQSIREKVKKGPLDLSEVLDIAIQAAQGLQEAHKRGIIHRDIKSANIMVTGSGQAKVMDFGIAKVAGAPLITREAVTMGTVAYMSPEQARGEEVDSRTDIWSLGVVLYEMLTGQIPFRGENDQSVMYSIVHKSPTPMKKIVPKITPELERVVEKALEKNPVDRYQNMGELLEDLRAIAEGLKPLRAKTRLLKGKILGIKSAHFFVGFIVLVALIGFGLLMILPDRGDILDSIAILPLVNDSGDPSQDYFANSLTDRLIAEFYKVSALRVVSRQAVMTYAKTTKSPQQIARELNVTAIVEASVLKSGNKVRLIARLIDPKRNNQIWGDTFERDYSDILFLQSDLAQAIVKGVKVAVKPEESALIASAHKVDPKAYDLFLKGINLYHFLGGKEDLRNAIDFLERAIATDPNFAIAYAWLGCIYYDLQANFMMPEKEAYPKIKASISRAIELDETLSTAHEGLAWLKCDLDWDFTGAEKEFLRALKLEPGNPDTQFGYSVFLGQVIGRFDEGIARLKRLIEEPSLQNFWYVKHAAFLLGAGRYDEALEAAQKAVDRDPEKLISNVTHATAYAMKGNYADAISKVDKMMELPGAQNDYDALLTAAIVFACSGSQDNAFKIMENVKILLNQNNINPSIIMAMFHSAIGDKDQAFEYLYDAYKEHLGSLVCLRTHWWFHSLHDDPRFHDLVKKVGFSDSPTSEN